MEISSIVGYLFGFVRAPVWEASVFIAEPANALLFSALLAVAACSVFGEKKLLPFIATCVVAGMLLGMALKPIIAQPRPCELSPSKIPCPLDFSLPSLHALAAFCLALSALGNRSFWIFLPFALFVAFSRVYLGVHTVAEVAAGLSLAFLACVAGEMLWIRMGWKLPVQVHLTKHSSRLEK